MERTSTGTQRDLNAITTPSPGSRPRSAASRASAMTQPVRSKIAAARSLSRAARCGSPSSSDSSATINRSQPTSRGHGASLSAARAYISRAARISPETSSTPPRMVNGRAHPHLVAGGLEPGQAAPGDRQAAVDVAGHRVQQGDVDLGQQLPPTIAQPEAELPGQEQRVTGRPVVAGVTLDAAELVQGLRPGQVVAHLGELLDRLGDDGHRRHPGPRSAGSRSRSRPARTRWPGRRRPADPAAWSPRGRAPAVRRSGPVARPG